MRRSLLGLVVLTGLSVTATPAKAQVPSLLADPSFTYFGLYLPRQQALANQVRSNDVVAEASANRVSQAVMTDRENVFNNGGDPFGLDELDQGGLFGRQTSRTQRRAAGYSNTSFTGSGPTQYFMRHTTPTAAHYPTIRVGRFTNQNLAQIRRGATSRGGVGSASSYGMGSAMGIGGGMR